MAPRRAAGRDARAARTILDRAATWSRPVGGPTERVEACSSHHSSLRACARAVCACLPTRAAARAAAPKVLPLWRRRQARARRVHRVHGSVMDVCCFHSPVQCLTPSLQWAAGDKNGATFLRPLDAVGGDPARGARRAVRAVVLLGRHGHVGHRVRRRAVHQPRGAELRTCESCNAACDANQRGAAHQPRESQRWWSSAQATASARHTWWGRPRVRPVAAAEGGVGSCGGSAARRAR